VQDDPHRPDLRPDTEEEASRVRPLSRALPAAALLAVGALAGGCTDHSEPAARPTPSASPTASTTPAPAPESVPFKVVVTRVSGKLPEKSRPALEANVGKALSAYVDGAFLAGDYPRSDFRAAFGVFTPGAARDARRDQGLLTNRRLGPSTESVRATRRTAYLSVLAPYKVAAGVTAKVDLVFVVDRGDRTAQRVRLAGRLLLTRNKSNGWSVFGYDLHRSQTPRSES
jgi:hypothetical protein